MNEAQVWTSIGVLGTSLLAVLTLMSTLFVRIIQAEIGAVRTEIRRVEDVMTTRFAHLDRDVQAIARKVFGDDAA